MRSGGKYAAAYSARNQSVGGQRHGAIELNLRCVIWNDGAIDRCLVFRHTGYASGITGLDYGDVEHFARANIEFDGSVYAVIAAVTRREISRNFRVG